MTSTSAVIGMLRADWLRMLRDRFLIGTTLYIVGISVLMRWLLPWIASGVAARWNFDLRPWFPLIVSHLVVQLAALIPGIVGGFLLLESREDRTVRALLVCPVPLRTYVTVIGLVMFAASTGLTIVEGALIGWGLPPWPALVGAGLAGAPAAPAMALFIAGLAENKVEAFAYMKFFGIAPLVATGAYFLPPPWQWLAAAYPPYWASKAYWVAEAGGNAWPLWVLGGLVASAIWVYLLWRMFQKAART